MTPYSPDGYGHEVKVHVKSGWNLIANMQGIYAISEDSEVSAKDIKAAYAYVPSLNKYLEIFPENEYAGYLDHWQEVTTEEEIIYLAFASIWLYVDDGGYITYKNPHVPKFKEVSLYKGWNFFTMTPELKYKAIKDFK